MRTYKVTGMTCGGCEKSVTRAIKKQLGEHTAVEANARAGEVRPEDLPREWVDLNIRLSSISWHWADPPDLMLALVYRFEWTEMP